MKKTLLNKEYIHIFFDQENNVLSEDWNATALPDEVREALEEKLRLYEKLKVEQEEVLWISNLNGMRGLDKRASDWVRDEFHPKLHPAGVREIAYLVPEQVYYELSEEQLETQYDANNTIRIAYFTDYISAVNWLKNVTKTNPMLSL